MSGHCLNPPGCQRLCWNHFLRLLMLLRYSPFRINFLRRQKVLACRLGAHWADSLYRVIISTDDAYLPVRVWPIPHLAHSAQKRRCTKTGARRHASMVPVGIIRQVMGLSMNSLLSTLK